MPEPPDPARPMMRRGAGLHADDTGREPLKERQNMPALQLTADDHLSRRTDAVDLKHRFSDVETDCRDRLHAWLPHNRDRPSGDHSNGTYVPAGKPSTASQSDLPSDKLTSLSAPSQSWPLPKSHGILIGNDSA